MKLRIFGAMVGTAALLLVSACGGSGAGSENSDTLNIGLICSCSGDYASAFGAVDDAAAAWESWTNDNGGINGHPVNVIIKDDGNDPARGLRAARELIEQDRVSAIVGEVSTVDASWANYVEEKGVPVVGGNPLGVPHSTNANFFPIGSSPPVWSALFFLDMQKRGLKHIAVMYCAEAQACATFPEAAKAGIRAVGAGISVSGVQVSASSPDFNSQCLAMKNEGADALFAAVTTDQGPKLVGNCADLGWKPTNYNYITSVGPSWYDGSVDGTLIMSPERSYLDASSPAIKTMMDTFAQYAPGLRDKAEYGQAVVHAWAGLQLFVAAAESGDLSLTSTPEDVRKSLYSLKDETLDGLVPPVNYTEGESTFLGCAFVYEVGEGTLVTREGSDGGPQCLASEQAEALETNLPVG